MVRHRQDVQPPSRGQVIVDDPDRLRGESTAMISMIAVQVIKDVGLNPRFFYRVVLALARPALGVVAIFTFPHSWNLYLEPIVYLSTPDMFTLPQRSPSS